MNKFKNKYRISSARHPNWDYGDNAAYYITICTANKTPFFGNVNNGKMELSHLGIIADILWHEIPNHSKYVVLGNFVVMPNHIHGILILDKPFFIENAPNVPNTVETEHALSLPYFNQKPKPQQTPNQSLNPKTIGQKRFQNIGKNTVSSIIGSYKSAVTKHANRLMLENGWQTRFHDHIIKDDAEYQRISDYIINNPTEWKDDELNKI